MLTSALLICMALSLMNPKLRRHEIVGHVDVGIHHGGGENVHLGIDDVHGVVIVEPQAAAARYCWTSPSRGTVALCM